MIFRPELFDELLQGYENPQDLLGEGRILRQLTAALVERCLNAEMKTHLEEQRSEAVNAGSTAVNRRNGHSKKTMLQKSGFANKGEFGHLAKPLPGCALPDCLLRCHCGKVRPGQHLASV